jgi:hypothetical protein
VAAFWSKLCALNAGIPDAASTMQIIESAEGIALTWYTASQVQTQGIIAGRLVEDIGGETAIWMLSGISSSNDAYANGAAWTSIPTSSDYPPLGGAMSAYNANNSYRAWTFAIDASGLLIGCGRAHPEVFSGNSVIAGLANATQAAFTTILLGGGAYSPSQKDALVGIMRQVRWGPPAYRGQRLYAGSPIVEQGIHLNYAIASSGAKVGGLWFDHFR